MIQSQSARASPSKMVKNARQRKRSLLMALPPAFADSHLILADRSREG
jgi:hypothetical protein